MRFLRGGHRRGHNGAALVWRGRIGTPGKHTIEVDVHLAWLLTMCTIAWLLAQALLPRLFPSWLPAAYWLVALSVAVIDSAAGLLHELGHALAAMAKGRRVYRITLYGLAASVYRSSGHLGARDQAAIAIAGPICHLLIGALLWTVWQLLPREYEPLRVATGLPALSSLVVGVINLLPLQPLDGGRAARALLLLLLRS